MRTNEVVVFCLSNLESNLAVKFGDSSESKQVVFKVRGLFDLQFGCVAGFNRMGEGKWPCGPPTFSLPSVVIYALYTG